LTSQVLWQLHRPTWRGRSTEDLQDRVVDDLRRQQFDRCTRTYL